MMAHPFARNLIVKCTLVGAPSVGKTCLLISYCTGEFPRTDYIPPVFGSHTEFATNNAGERVQIAFWDTAARTPDQDQMRPVAYPGTNVLLLCFAIDDPASFAAVRNKFAPEVAQHCPGVPILLVGTKGDLRDDTSAAGLALIAREESESLAREIGAAQYLECSAVTREGVQAVIDQAVRSGGAGPAAKKQRRCAIM